MRFFKFPNAIVLIFFLILTAQLISYVIPSGRYDRIIIDGSTQVLPSSFHQIQHNPLPIFTFLTAIPRGMLKSAEIILFVLLIGGALAVIRATGAIDALIRAAVTYFEKRPTFLVAVCMTLFAVGSSTIGMAEEYLSFVPLLVTMCLALKMDAVVALAIVYVGAGIGYGCAALNPFTVAIAQRLAGVPIYSDQLSRWGLLVFFLIIGVHHTLKYARTTIVIPKKNVFEDLNFRDGLKVSEKTPLTLNQIILLCICTLSIPVFVFGVSHWHWFLNELSAVFLGLTLLAACFGRLSPNNTAQYFSKGAAELAPTALVIGFARTIEIVLDDASIKDTIIHGVVSTLEGLPAALAVIGMLVVQTGFNFLIPSGSGQAFVTMPIMAPVADLTRVGREAAVFAYQFGDGFSNMIIPTNAILMGMLSLAKVPYYRWFRFTLPLLGKIYLVAIVFLILKVSL